MDCLPLLCPPGGPGTPFGSPVLAVLDTVRVVLWLLCVFIIGKALVAVFALRTLRQRAIYLAMSAGAFAALGTEVDHLGDYAHYRLALLFVFGVAGAWGLFRIERRVRDWSDADPEPLDLDDDTPRPRRHRR